MSKRKDLPEGFRSGKLTVIRRLDRPNPKNRSWYLCACDCGGNKECRKDALTSQQLKSCGCIKPIRWDRPLSSYDIEFITLNYQTMNRSELAKELNRDPIEIGRKVITLGLKKRKPTTHLPGTKFGNFTLIKDLGSVGPKGGKKRLYQVKCDCGVVKEIRRPSLISGSTISCGCEAKRRISARAKKEPGLATYNGMYSNYKNNASPRGHSFELSSEEFVEITSKKCFYCDSNPPLVNKYIKSNGTTNEKSGVTNQKNSRQGLGKNEWHRQS